jgi:hypothetical protein
MIAAVLRASDVFWRSSREDPEPNPRDKKCQYAERRRSTRSGVVHYSGFEKRRGKDPAGRRSAEEFFGDILIRWRT